MSGHGHDDSPQSAVITYLNRRKKIIYFFHFLIFLFLFFFLSTKEKMVTSIIEILPL